MVSVGLGTRSTSYAPGGSSIGGACSVSAVKNGIAAGGSVGVRFDVSAGISQVGVGSRLSISVGPAYGVIPGSISGVRSSVGYTDSYAVTIGQGVDGAPFRASVDHGSVRFRSADGVEATVVGSAVVGGGDVGAEVIGVAVDLGVIAFVDGAAVVEAVVEGREVVLRTAGEGVAGGACVVVFAATVEMEESAERPGLVGRAVWTAIDGEADALRVGDAIPVGPGVTACAAQRQRPTMVKRRRTGFTNSLTVQLPWGRTRGGGKSSAQTLIVDLKCLL